MIVGLNGESEPVVNFPFVLSGMEMPPRQGTCLRPLLCYRKAAQGAFLVTEWDLKIFIA